MKLIRAFVFAAWILQVLVFLNLKTSSLHLLCLYSMVCVGPVLKQHFDFLMMRLNYVFFSLFRRNFRAICLVIVAVLLVMLVVKQEQAIQITTSAGKELVANTPPTTGTTPDNKINTKSGSSENGGLTDVVTPRHKPKTRHIPRTHIAFLKVHKAASSTVQNILYRFGSGHNLSFVLPQEGHYISKDPYNYFNILPPLDKAGKFDILCNHAVYNEAKFKILMHDDAFYLAIVRNPLQRFVSAAYYYRYVVNLSYLSKMNQTSFIHDLIVDPLKYEPESLNNSKTFNRLAFDFGLGVSSIKQFFDLNEITVNMFVQKILERFDFVMLVERFDESLVMLKRYLNWTIKDILYIKQNQFQDASNGIEIQNVSVQEEGIFKQTNRLDYLIYDKFVERFNEMAATEKDLDTEVMEFKHKLRLVQAYCTRDNSHRDIYFTETAFNVAFSVSRNDCHLMMKNELTFNDELRTVHRYRLENK